VAAEDRYRAREILKAMEEVPDGFTE
jgi:hypothetical protein